MKRITFIGAINSFTGYGQLAIQIIRDLQRLAGVFVSVRPVSKSEPFGSKIPADIAAKFVTGPQPEEWELLLHPPLFCPTPGKKTAYFTMWESTQLPPGAVQMLNKAEVVIVPCAWNASCFSACGVTAPIRIVPLGVDKSKYHFQPMQMDGKCVFGTAGRISHGGPRKGINEVVSCFQRAFPRETDVELRVKCFPDCRVDRFSDPRIKVIQSYLSDDAMADWYSGLTCFASASMSEGWGLMQHQAMAVGRPVISVNFGGVSEFFNSGAGYQIDFKLVKSDANYRGLGHWACPNSESIVQAMRSVYEDRPEAAKLGLLASESVKHLTWENHGRKLIEVLEEFGAIGKTADQVEIIASHPKEITFLHSGDLGDIIYSLPFIRARGGGGLVLSPDFGNGAHSNSVVRERMTRQRAEMLIPLLRDQPYITGCEYADRAPDEAFNLNRFRHIFNDHAWDWLHQIRDRRGHRWPPHNLSEYYWEYFGGDVPKDLNVNPWLRVTKAKPYPLPIVINRTLRYTDTPPKLDWRSLVSRFGCDMVFVGLPEEHAAFKSQYGYVDYCAVDNFLDLAELIRGSKLFIGNESFPLSIAHGLMHPTVVEGWRRTHCFYPRPNALHVHDPEDSEKVLEFVKEAIA
jgi:glycosyltransferase involved in cell wall biosynthesis